MGLSFDVIPWSVESLIYELWDKFVVLESKSDTIIPTSINRLKDFSILLEIRDEPAGPFAVKNNRLESKSGFA